MKYYVVRTNDGVLEYLNNFQAWTQYIDYACPYSKSVAEELARAHGARIIPVS